MENFKAAGIIPDGFSWQQKKKFLKDSSYFIWDDPYLFKIGGDGLLRRCVSRGESKSILWHCHNSPYGDILMVNALQPKYCSPVSIGRQSLKILTSM
jgi:hypothetical protein